MFICGIRHSVVHSRSHSPAAQWHSAVHSSSALMHLHLSAQSLSLLQPHSIAPDSSVMRGELSSTRAGWLKVANDMWVIHLDTETEDLVPKYCPSKSQPGK